MTSSVYDSASELFLVKDFSGALRTLRSVPLGPDSNAWLLYFALCDRAFIEPDNAEWPRNDAGRKGLTAEIVKGSIWVDLLEQWEPAIATLPPSVVLAGFKLATKYRGEPDPIVVFVEALLAQTAISPRVFEAFVLDILAGLQHDFFYARELVKSRASIAEEARTALLAAIDEREAAYEAEKQREQQALQQLEKQRLEQAIAQAENASDSDTASYNEVKEKEVAEVRSRREPHQQRTLVQFWRNWLHNFIRSQGLYNALIFIFMLLAALNNGRLRGYINHGGRWAWQTIKASLKMGLSVTYL